MPKQSYGDVPKNRTRRLFALLLDCAYGNVVLSVGETCTELKGEKPRYRFQVTRTGLSIVAHWQQWTCGEGLRFDPEDKNHWDQEIYRPLTEYLEKFLEIADTRADGKTGKWVITLNLLHNNKEENLVDFDNRWDEARHASKSLTKSKPSGQTKQGIDWHTECRKLLEKHKENLASNSLQATIPKNFDVYVPLGVVKREEKQRPAIARDLDPSAERGSEFYREQTTPISHDAFLEAVRDRQSPQHIAILGEPGAGKTTLLTKVWESLIGSDFSESSQKPSIVAWVPLAALKDKDLVTYLQQDWLGQICPTANIPSAYWDKFEALANAGEVWLLLDGADEMGGDGLTKIANILKQRWADSLRAIVTCRLNLWDAGNSNELKSDFKIFRTLEFSYKNPDKQNEEQDEVNTFINKWFAGAEAGTRLRSALNEPGKERIKDLAQNPLRLTLLCNIWRRNENLPDTQAGLYKGFVNYFNTWKATKLVNSPEALDRAMGKLAKSGLNKPSLRFRFTKTEIQQKIGSKYLEDLKAAGWLNCVGSDREQQTEEIYAFFHPTFQEYFAACAIEDWDYFLPSKHQDKPVNCEGEEVLTYRVFEAEWRQVILLWVGREDVAEERREEFIKKLMNFEDGFGNNFYYCYHAYCMAAICVGEFKSSRRAESIKSVEIIQQIVTLAFGYFNTEEQEWRDCFEPISSLATDTIPFIHRQTAITALIELLENIKLPDWRHSNVAEALGTIAVGNQKAIETLIELLKNDNLETLLRSSVASALGEIAVGNKQAIEVLLELIKISNLDCELRSSVASALGEIAVGNKQAIEVLLELIKNLNLDIMLFDNVALALGEIAVGNKQAIEVLLELIKIPNLVHWLRSSVALALGEIAVGNEQAIEVLLELIKNPNLEDRLYFSVAITLGTIAVGNLEAIAALIKLLANPNFEDGWRYNSCFRVLFRCSQILPYPNFYTAWHSPLPPSPSTPPPSSTN